RFLHFPKMRSARSSPMPLAPPGKQEPGWKLVKPAEGSSPIGELPSQVVGVLMAPASSGLLAFALDAESYIAFFAYQLRTVANQEARAANELVVFLRNDRY